MEKSQDIRHGRHCVYAMHVHLVFVAKYRKKVFDKESIDRLRGYFAGSFGGATLDQLKRYVESQRRPSPTT